MDQVRRKRIRLPASNYEAGWYFVTICTDHRTNFLANVTPTVGADDSVRPCVALEGYTSRLTPIGLAVRECLERLTDAVHGVVVDKYIIMPNHVHAIICLSAGTGGQSRPPLQIPLRRRYKPRAQIVTLVTAPLTAVLFQTFSAILAILTDLRQRRNLDVFHIRTPFL